MRPLVFILPLEIEGITPKLTKKRGKLKKTQLKQVSLKNSIETGKLKKLN
jgi:hypothetical protein